ncbi:MAG TPA: metallophosphoesterase family protein [Alphaproteobacteria bacterium]|nr:metallophosphoesterase family protein [Alphaproteobacteria bacterium]
MSRATAPAGSERADFLNDADTKPPYRVPEGTRVYAVGDIHGRADLLATLRKKIVKDAKKAPKKAGIERKVVVYLGDYIDRGPDSFGVIEMLLDEPLDGFEEVYLKGNHEDYMAKFLIGDGDGLGWLFNGAENTIASYGVEPGNWMDFEPEKLRALRAGLFEAIPERHHAFLDRLALRHAEGGYLFVHAGIRPEVPLAAQDDEDLMWIREDFLDSEADHMARVVHGHTISWTPEFLPNRIGIDTGAFVSGVLTALVVEGAETRVITAIR